MSAGDSRPPTSRTDVPRVERGEPAQGPRTVAVTSGEGVGAEARSAYISMLDRLRSPQPPGGSGAPAGPAGAVPGPCPAGELTGGLTDDVVRWLTERHLLSGDGTGLSSPERALGELVTGHGEQLREVFSALEQNIRALEDVTRLLPPPRLYGEETAQVEFFHDRAELRRRIDDFHPIARRELLGMRTTFPEPEILEESLVIDLEMLARGARCRMLVSSSASRRPGAGRYLEALAGAGAEVRVAVSVPLHLLIIDRELTVMWAGIGTDRRCGDVAMHGPLIASCFVQVFEHTWTAAAPRIPGDPARRANAVQEYTPQEREVLTLLATGAKDESIARRLGVSERTLRRLMTQLVEKLGVESRFAAGVQAARLGLVD